MHQVSALLKMSSCCRKLACTGTLLSMVQASIAAMMTNGT